MKKLTKPQTEWVDMCKKNIGDPIGLEKFMSSESADFYNDVVSPTCKWWEMHAADILHNLQDMRPND